MGAFSERAAQIGRNIDRYEAEWRTANPGQEPGPAVRRSWDRRAWKDARPDKIAPKDGAELVAAWNQQLRDLGYRDPTTASPGLPMVLGAPRVGEFDRDAAVETILVRLGARRSAWNAADIRGQAEKAIAAAGLVVDPAVRTELAEDLTARAIDGVRAAAAPAGCSRARPSPDLTPRAADRGRHRGPARGPRQRPPRRRPCCPPTAAD